MSYDDYHVSMQMAALALRAKNIALDAAMKSGAAEIEQLRRRRRPAREGGRRRRRRRRSEKAHRMVLPLPKAKLGDEEDENRAENEDDRRGTSAGPRRAPAKVPARARRARRRRVQIRSRAARK